MTKAALQLVVSLAIIILVVAVALRIAWELLAPVLIPLSLVLLGIGVVAFAWRNR